MQENEIVLGMWERPVYHVDSGLTSISLTVVTLYLLPDPHFVLTRETLTPNATDVTVSYTEIPGRTLKECCKNMAAMSSMIWKPVRA